MSAASITSTAVAVGESGGTAATRRARASVAFGRKRGYYRLLFDAGAVDAATFAALARVPERRAAAWLEEQVAAGVLRPVTGPDGRRDEVLLPGEFVPLLVGDDGDRSLDAARTMLDEHGSELPEALRDLVGRAPATVVAADRTVAAEEFRRTLAFTEATRVQRFL